MVKVLFRPSLKSKSQPVPPTDWPPLNLPKATEQVLSFSGDDAEQLSVTFDVFSDYAIPTHTRAAFLAYQGEQCVAGWNVTAIPWGDNMLDLEFDSVQDFNAAEPYFNNGGCVVFELQDGTLENIGIG